MPLLQGQPFKLVERPSNIDEHATIYKIPHTGEQFLSRSDYEDRLALYSQNIWTCQCTGHGNMSHQDAWTSEAKVRIMLQTQMPEPYRRPVLSLVHHSTSSLEQLVELASSYCYAMFQIGEEIDYKPDEPKAKPSRYRVLASRVVEVPEKEMATCSSNTEGVSVNGCIEASDAESAAVTNGQESNGADRPGRASPEKSPKQKNKLQNDRVYDLEEIVPDGVEPRIIRDVPVTCLHRKGKPPSKDTLRLFIRANAFRPKSSSHSPWVVSDECINKYNIPSKFTPILNTPSSSSVKRKASAADANHKPAKIPKVSLASDSSEHERSTETNITTSFSQEMPTKTSGNDVDDVSSTSDSVRSYANGTTDEKSNNSSDEIEFVGAVSASNRTEESPESLLQGLRQYTPSSVPDTPKVSQSTPSFAHHTLLSHFASHAANLPHLLNSPHLSQGLFNPHLNAFSPLYQSLISNNMISSQNSSLNSSFSSLNSSQSSVSSFGTPKSQTLGRNVTIGPDGQPRKRRGRPPMTEEERARKRILQKQMAEVFQNLGVTSSPHRPKSPAHQFEPSSTKSPSPLASPTSKSPVKKVHTSESVMKMPLVRRLLFEFRNRKTNKGFARKVVYTMDHAVTKLSLAQINLITDEQVKEALMVRYERLKEKEMMQGMSQSERESYMKEKARVIATKRRREKQALNRKSEDQNLENLTPLPVPTPVTTFENLPSTAFCDIAMLSEFMESFSEVFNLPSTSKKPLFTTAKILEAVSQGKKGYSYISSLLCTMLPTVVYDAANTHYKELGIPLREMPISYQTAPELARLCLKHQKLDEVVIEEVSEDGELLVMGEEEDELSEDLLEKLSSVELWELSAGELVAFLKALTHRCMASDALASHVDKLEDLATKIYKERAHLKKERLKEDIELKQKRREERKAKKKPKKPPGRPKGYSPRLGMTIADFYERKEHGVEISPRKDSLLNCRQKRKSALDKMEDEKREQEQKEQEKAKLIREERFRECEELLQKRRRTLRITPLGYDRDHNRYWLFCNSTPGLYVEKYYMGSYISYTVDPPEDSENLNKPDVSSCEIAATDEQSENGTNEECGSANGNNSELPAEAEVEEAYTPAKGRPRAVSLLDMDIDNQTLPPTGENAWFVYKTEEEIEALLKALADNGVREHYLKHNILSARERISRNLAALAAQENSNNNSISAVKSEVPDTAEGEDDQNISTVEAESESSKEKPNQANVKKEPKKEEEAEEDWCARMLLSLREDIIQIELELREGWLGAVENFEQWQKAVQDTSDVSVLGKCLIEAQRAMHLKNLKGFMAPSRKAVPASVPAPPHPSPSAPHDESQSTSSDSPAPEEKKQGGEKAGAADGAKPQQPQPEYIEVEGSGVLKWREAVQACKTYSRLHVLVGMFDSCIKWERSLATKKCTVCRSKDKDTSPLILCEKCEKSYHWSCLRPKLTGDPPATWYCPACLMLPRSPTRAKSGARAADIDHDEDDKTRGGSSSSKNRSNRSLVLEASVSEPECCVCYGRLGLIFCCVCSAAYHSECHNPPPLTRARKDWKCSECEKNAKTAAKEQSARSASSGSSSSRDSTQTEAKKAETSEKRRQQSINKPRSRTGQFLSKAALAALAKRNEAKLKKSAELAAKQQAQAVSTVAVTAPLAKETRSGYLRDEISKSRQRTRGKDEDQVVDEEDDDEDVRNGDDIDNEDDDDEEEEEEEEDEEEDGNEVIVIHQNEEEEEEDEDEEDDEDDDNGDVEDVDEDDENGVDGSDEEGVGVELVGDDVEEEDSGSDNETGRGYDEDDEVEEDSQDEEEEEYDEIAGE